MGGRAATLKHRPPGQVLCVPSLASSGQQYFQRSIIPILLISSILNSKWLRSFAKWPKLGLQPALIYCLWQTAFLNGITMTALWHIGKITLML